MHINLKLSLVIGLAIGFAVCGHSSLKPVHTASKTPRGVIQVPMSLPYPMWVGISSTPTLTETQPTIEPQPTPMAQQTLSTIPHTDLLSAAGIDSSQWASAEELVQRESSWNPNAYNSEGACSLVQSLPCWKIPGDWTNPVTALTWGDSYVVSRYGSWDAALVHSLAFNYY